MTATRILWGSDLPLRAVGVEYLSAAHETIQVLASKEVLLAAGAIGSPKILELSGVGNKT